jgi:hypothetical protein
MTRQTLERPLTVGDVLLGHDDPVSRRVLERSLDLAGVSGTACQAVGALSTVGRAEIRSRLTEAAKDLLGGRIVDAVFAGWHKQAELVEAAEATAGDPDKTVLVDLCAQRIETSDGCTLELALDGWTAASFHFVVTLAFDIDPMLAIVRGGRLIGLRGGNCDIQASLAVDGQQVAQHRLRIELNKVVSLGTGLPLCRTASPPADSAKPATHRQSAGG